MKRLSKLLVFLLFIGCAKDGSPGKTSLIRIANEIAGTNCTSGGFKIFTGIDNNDDGYLDDAEVQNEQFICNGTDGSHGMDGIDGSNGIDGTNGFNSMINYVYEPNGVNCSSGGYKILSGMDMNRNNNLDESEVQNSIFICNGLDGVNVGETTGGYDKQTIIHLRDVATEGTSIQWCIENFDIANYVNADSISFGAYLSNTYSTDSCYIELYDLTHNVVINNTLLVSNTFQPNYEWLTTKVNFISDLPSNPIKLGIRLKSKVNGHLSIAQNTQIIIYRK